MAVMWELLTLGVAVSGAFASDQAPWQAQSPKACWEERTSLLQTASVVQKRSLAVAPPRLPRTAAEGKVQEARATSEKEASIRLPVTPPRLPQASAGTLVTKGEKVNSATSTQQEASEHPNLATAKPSDRPKDTMKPDAPPPFWFACLGKVTYCTGAFGLLSFAILVYWGKLQDLLPPPKYASIQDLDNIRDGWPLYILLMSITGQSLLVTDQYLPSLTQMQVDFDTTPGVMALSLQVNWFAIGVSALFTAAVGDIVGRKPTLLLSVLMTFAASMGCASATSVCWFIAGCALQGISLGAQTISMVLIKDVVDDKDERLAYTASIFGGLTLCPSLAPAFGGFIANFTSWRAPFIVLAGWSLVNIVCVALLLPETRSAPTADKAFEEYREEFTRLQSDRRIVALGVCQGLCVSVMFSVDTNFSQVLGNTFHQSTAEIAWKLAVNAVSLLVPIIMVEALSESSVGPCKLLRYLFGVSFLPAVVAFVVGSFTSSWQSLMGCVLAGQLPMIAAYVVTSSLYLQTAEDASGAAAGISKGLEMTIASFVSLVASMVVKGSPNAVGTLQYWMSGLIVTTSIAYWLGFGIGPPDWAVRSEELEDAETFEKKEESTLSPVSSRGNLLDNFKAKRPRSRSPTNCADSPGSPKTGSASSASPVGGQVFRTKEVRSSLRKQAQSGLVRAEAAGLAEEESIAHSTPE